MIGAPVTIEDFLRMLLRHALLLILGVLVGAAAGFGYSYMEPEVYSANALGYVSSSGQVDPDGNPVAQATGNMQFQYSKAQTYLPLFGTRAVGERIVDQLGMDASPDAVAGSLTTSLDPNAPIITVTATAGTPQEASDIANAAVQAAAAEAKELETGGNANVDASVALVPYQTALTPGAPISPDRKKFLAFGAAAGLLVALGLAWLRDRNDSRLRQLSDVPLEQIPPLLGSLPELKELHRSSAESPLPEPRSFQAREALRKLRTNLRFVDVDKPPRAIVVTSSMPGEGKSTVAANLARVMARAGYRTLLIDADLRRPVVAASFEIDGRVGLSQLLAGTVRLDDVVTTLPKSRLSLLPAGQIPPNPSELLGSRRMHELIKELSRTYFVILDAPPVLAVTDAQLLSSHTDGALVVAIPGRSRIQGVTAAIQAIRGVNASVYGVVMNRVKSGRLNRLAYGDVEYGTYGSYGYGAAYGYDTKDYGPMVEETEIEGAAVEQEERVGTPSAPRRARRIATPVDGAGSADGAARAGGHS